MCGIIGYIGPRPPKDILIEGLKKLEYRGYDSSGIALQNENDVQIIKSKGKIKALEEKIQNIKLIDSNLGIAHTRWATHGIPNEKNAHPHQVGNITIVHNGIIENANYIREKLQKENILLQSETDTEVACALIDYHYRGNILETLAKVQKELKGSYAIGLMVKNNKSLYAIRKDSPLIIGLGTNECFIASDISAIINHTKKYILLEEGEIAEITKGNCKIYKNNQEVTKEVLNSDLKGEEIDKGKYNHFMIKEIMEQPLVLEKTLKPYIDNLDLLPNLDNYEEIHIVACGSALYAGMIGKSLLEEKANIKCQIECASEYRYKKTIYDRKTLIILVSQSGETADTIAALKKAKENGIPTLAIVNVKSSTIARESDFQIFIEAGKEIAVATTKAYLLQVAILSLLSYKASKKHIGNFTQELKELPSTVESILKQENQYKKIAQQIYKHDHLFFIGRKIDYSICLEGCLKLKEVSYIHSEAYQAGELKHGTISLIENKTPIIAIMSDDDIKEKTASNIEELKSRNAFTIVISTEKYQNCDINITVPKINCFLEPILIAPILQLIAYETAKLRGCEIDQPKNLAKSVTVE